MEVHLPTRPKERPRETARWAVQVFSNHLCSMLNSFHRKSQNVSPVRRSSRKENRKPSYWYIAAVNGKRQDKQGIKIRDLLWYSHGAQGSIFSIWLHIYTADVSYYKFTYYIFIYKYACIYIIYTHIWYMIYMWYIQYIILYTYTHTYIIYYIHTYILYILYTHIYNIHNIYIHVYIWCVYMYVCIYIFTLIIHECIHSYIRNQKEY